MRGLRPGAMLQPCGTRAAYARGCRCAACTAANAARRRQQYAIDPQSTLASVKAYYQRNTDKVRTSKQRYYRGNKPAFLARNLIRRARVHGATGSVTIDDLRGRLHEFAHRCAYCDQPIAKLHWDHGVPLSRGGCNDIMNLFPACARCNNTKYTKTVDEFVSQRLRDGRTVHPRIMELLHC